MARGDVREFMAIKIAFHVQNYHYATAYSVPLYTNGILIFALVPMLEFTKYSTIWRSSLNVCLRQC